MFRRGLRRAALLCAWFSDLKLQCLFATFLSTSLDDFEALGANFSALGAILEAILRQRDFRTFFASILGPS